jgi:hypothetical protein
MSSSNPEIGSYEEDLHPKSKIDHHESHDGTKTGWLKEANVANEDPSKQGSEVTKNWLDDKMKWKVALWDQLDRSQAETLWKQMQNPESPWPPLIDTNSDHAKANIGWTEWWTATESIKA